MPSLLIKKGQVTSAFKEMTKVNVKDFNDLICLWQRETNFLHIVLGLIREHRHQEEKEGMRALCTLMVFCSITLVINDWSREYQETYIFMPISLILWVLVDSLEVTHSCHISQNVLRGVVFPPQNSLCCFFTLSSPSKISQMSGL